MIKNEHYLSSRAYLLSVYEVDILDYFDDTTPRDLLLKALLKSPTRFTYRQVARLMATLDGHSKPFNQSLVGEELRKRVMRARLAVQREKQPVNLSSK